MSFAETLKTLPSVAHLAALRLLDEQGAVLATIDFALAGEFESFQTDEMRASLQRMLTPKK